MSEESQPSGVDAGPHSPTDGGSVTSPPGGGLLSAEPVTPPQFENGPGWSAPPLLVSGTDGYHGGEYRYQDYVYDDKGAYTGEEPFDPPQDAPTPVPNPTVVSAASGCLVYPTDEAAYGYNAADLLEFRTRPTDDGVAYRLTLQTMLEPAVAAVAIGIDTGESGGTEDWGYGVGSLGPLALDHVLVTWGTGAELDGDELPDDRVSLTTERNQLEVEVPLEPDGETWRHYAVVGLFDADERRFLEPVDERNPERPGGARGEDPPPIFNVAFRFDETGGVTFVERFNPFADDPGMEKRPVPYGAWREHGQAMALADRDISGYHADVDFGKLEAGETDEDVARPGYTNRLYASRHDAGAGVRREFVPNSGQRPSDDRSTYDLLCNRVQPYGLYVPEDYDPAEPAPLHVNLHGGSANHNTLRPEGTFLRQIGEERGAIVLVPCGRGPGVFYQNEGELDVLEAIADVRARYNVDGDRVTIGGTSMGGFGTFKMASRYPDLFAKAFPLVGSFWPGPERLLDSLRHVPVFMWNGLRDDLATPAEFLPAHLGLQRREYAHELWLFLEDGHLDAKARDEWEPVQSFLEGEYLGPATVTRDPARVTYTRLPGMECPDLGLRHDGAYWIDDVRLADGADAGHVDARSRARPAAETTVEHRADLGTDPAEHVVLGTHVRGAGDGTADDGTDAAADHGTGVADEHGTDAAADHGTDAANELELTLEGVASVTIGVPGAGLDADAPITVEVDSTDPATVTLMDVDARAEISVPAGESSRSVSLSDR